MDQRKFDGRWAVSVIVAGVVLALSAIAMSAPDDAASNAYEKALKPAEAMAGEWDFDGASTALAKLKFKDKAQSARLTGRREEVKRLAGLKTKIIEKVNKLKPWLRRGPAVVPGTRKIKTVGLQVNKAGEKSVTVTEVTVTDQTSTDKPWSKLNNKEVGKLLKITISDNSTDDQLAAGLLSLSRSDAKTAEGYFDKAKSLGAKTQRYLGPLATAAFAQVNELLKKKKFSEAGAALKALEKKYAKTPWMNSHKKELKTTRARITDAGAEKLYAQGVKLFKRGKAKYPDLKDVLQKLAKDYPSSSVLIDDNRKPSFTEMELAIEGRKLITVSQSGKAKHKTIQAAINAAPPKALVEIQDGATYEEEIIIAIEKKGLILRGKRGFWPVIKGPGKADAIKVRAPDVSIQQVVVAGTVHTNAKSCSLSEVIIAVKGGILGDAKDLKIDTCFIAATIGGYHRPNGASARNSFFLRRVNVNGNINLNNVFVGGRVHVHTGKLKSCTLADGLRYEKKGLTIVNSIVSHIEGVQKDGRIEYCNVYGKGYLLLAKGGKGCISKDPQFRDPKEFDYHLKLDSPCRKKASDGKDMGVRITRAMTAILKKAMALRAKGVIKF